MPLETIWCPVLNGQISRVKTLEGEVTTIICSEYDASTRTCRRRAEVLKAGPLSQLLERVAENTLGDATTTCIFV
jgi:hypothetical protein